jgi:hypothetical protein
MRLLIACEFSGRVRDAFIRKGHDAISCDLEPTLVDGPHIQGDVLEILDQGWDMMIAFPPCTYLASSGMQHTVNGKRPMSLTWKALAFVDRLLKAPIDKIALENPVGKISTELRRPTQIIQPYEFGHPESKKTCLWLKNLPKLQPTNLLELPADGRWYNQSATGNCLVGESKYRAKFKSLTYPGIAEAMAEQWSQ